ncbi:hypothetical protein NEUTE2DRAFT_49086, partial [Neurospora tetrasperma FGSC 2509]
KRRNLAGKNGNFNVRCHAAVVPLFWVGEGTSRIQEGAGRLSLPLIPQFFFQTSIDGI